MTTNCIERHLLCALAATGVLVGSLRFIAPADLVVVLRVGVRRVPTLSSVNRVRSLTVLGVLHAWRPTRVRDVPDRAHAALRLHGFAVVR